MFNHLSSGQNYPFKQGSFLYVGRKDSITMRELSGSLFSLMGLNAIQGRLN